MARESGSRVDGDPDPAVKPGDGVVGPPSGREQDPSVNDPAGSRRRDETGDSDDEDDEDVDRGGRQRDRDRDSEGGSNKGRRKDSDSGDGPVESRASPDKEDIDVKNGSSSGKKTGSTGLADRFRGAISRAADRARDTATTVGKRVDRFADRAGRTIDQAGETAGTVVDAADEAADTADQVLDAVDESVESDSTRESRVSFDEIVGDTSASAPDTSASADSEPDARRESGDKSASPSVEDLAGGGQGATEAVEDVAGSLPGSETAGKIAAAGAPVATAEPTPIGETGLAVITGGTIAGATALEAAERTRIDEELARLIGGGVTEQELPVADPTAEKSELPAKKEPANEQPELFPSGEPVQEGSELDPRRAIDEIVEVPVPAESEGDAGLRAGEQVGKVIGEQRRERSRSRQRREDSLLDRINDELERFERRKREEQRGRQRRERERERRRERSQEQRERRQERTDERAQRRRERAQETLEERRQRRRERAREEDPEILRELPTGGEAVVDEGVPGTAEADPEAVINAITAAAEPTELDHDAATEPLVGGETGTEPLVGGIEDEDTDTAPGIDTVQATDPAVDEQLDQITGTQPITDQAPDTAVDTVVDHAGLQERETIPLFGVQEPTPTEPAEAFPEEVADPTENAPEYEYPAPEETAPEYPPAEGSGGDDAGGRLRLPELKDDEREEERFKEDADTRVFPTAIGSGEDVLDALFSEENGDEKGDTPPLF